MATSTLFNVYLTKLAAGTLTAEEAGDSRLDVQQRQALIQTLAAKNSASSTIGGTGGSWGASTTLPVAKTPVHDKFDTTGHAESYDLIIPASLHYSLTVVSGVDVTTGANKNYGTVNDTPTIGAVKVPVDYELVIPPRVDGQAHPAVTFTIQPDTVVVYNYLPL